ncbi:MAG: ribonuclease Z [Flavobacteriales bacterium]|jgi:ribonuclease Z|nr:ribonuclease Z [Flavobacteriales bacterium]
MKSFELNILGSSSATPTSNRNPSGQILKFRNKTFLIDCGEGSQSQMRRYKLSFQKIDKIFISHLHGDHYLGLFGLLSTMSLNNRTKAVELYAPKDLEALLDLQKKVSRVQWSFPLHFFPTDPKTPQTLFEDESISIQSFPLEHRIETTGFIFREKIGERKLNPKALRDFEIPIYARRAIKKGADFEMENGEIITNKELTLDPDKPSSYAYCSDTVYKPEIVPLIQDVVMLYHEATFLHDLEKRAFETKHSTAKQAGEIAKMSSAQKLLIGHFSSRYYDLEPHKAEAQTVFENTELATEGSKFIF